MSVNVFAHSRDQRDWNNSCENVIHVASLLALFRSLCSLGVFDITDVDMKGHVGEEIDILC